MRAKVGEYFYKNRYLLFCFLINMLLGILSIGFFMFRDKGMFSLGTDYDSIVMPILDSGRKAIWRGDVFWNWSFDLGTDFVGSNSFLCLGSPFYWLTLLFPKVDYLYLGGWLFIIKYAVAGMTSGMYLQKFTEKKQYAIIGSILYAFSGFQVVNLMMGSFHDVVALFPLLLYGLEALVEENKKGVFAVTVFINAVTNYYFFVGEVIFLIIYFLIRFLWGNLNKIKKIPVCIMEGIIGIMSAGIIFYPSILFILQNPRSGDKISWAEYFLTNRRDILKVFRSFLFPGEMMQQWSCVKEFDWTSSSAYLPMIGMVLVFSYILKRFKKKDWLKRILIVCLIFMIVPGLSSLFTLMTDIYYRWYYMPILLFALASVKVMEHISEYPVKPVSAIILSIMVLSMVIFDWWDKNRFQIIFVERAYWVLNLTALIGVLIIWMSVYLRKHKKVYFGVLLIGIGCFAVFTTLYTCKRYRDVRAYETVEYKEKLEAAKKMGEMLDSHSAMYRLSNIDNILAMTMQISPKASTTNTVQGSIFELWNILGEEKRVVAPDIPVGYPELVGVGYYVTASSTMEEGWKLLGESELSGKPLYLYEDEAARPIGVTYDTYMLKEDFLNIPKENRAEFMKTVLVIEENDEILVTDKIEEYEENKENREQQSITNFSRNNKGFLCLLHSEGEKFALFTVPYARGWTAYVNGEKVTIVNAGGFMAIEVMNGENLIEFRYFNRDVLIGICLTIAGILLWIGRICGGRPVGFARVMAGDWSAHEGTD